MEKPEHSNSTRDLDNPMLSLIMGLYATFELAEGKTAANLITVG